MYIYYFHAYKTMKRQDFILESKDVWNQIINLEFASPITLSTQF